jgi:hypothetical protein
MAASEFRIASWRPTLIHYAGALTLGISLLLLMPVHRMLIGQNDFAHFYIGGTLFGTPGLHSPEANFALQKELVGGVLEHSYFLRPTFYGAFYKPLAALPYRAAYLIFQIFSLTCCFFFIRWNLRRLPGFAALAIMFPPLLANFVNGQDVMLLVTLCSLSLLLAENDRDFAAGLVLSLAAFKPHLFLLTPLAAGVHRRWRFVAGAATGLTTLFLIGLTSGGLESQRKLWQMIRNPDSSPYSGIMPTWRSVDGSGGPVYLLLCLATVLAIGYLAHRSKSFSSAFAWCLVGGLLISFHAYMQDCLLLLLALAVLAKELPRAASMALLLVALPLPYFFLQSGRPFSGLFVLMAASVPALAAWDAFRRSRSEDVADSLTNPYTPVAT